MRNFLIWVALCLIWGSTWVGIKVGLADIPAIPFAGIRFLIAASILLGLRAVSGRTILPPRQPGTWRFLILGGCLNFAVGYGLIFWAEQYVSAGLASLINAIQPGFTFLLAHRFVAAESLSWRKMSGLLLSIAGVATIVSDQLHVTEMALIGSLGLILSTMVFATFNIWAKLRAGTLEPSLVAGWHMLFGAVPLLLFSLPLYGNPASFHWTLPAILALFYLAVIGSSLAFFLYYYLLRRIPVGTVVTISLVTPVIAVVLDRVMLDENPGLVSLAGGMLILAGVGLIVRPQLPSAA